MCKRQGNENESSKQTNQAAHLYVNSLPEKRRLHDVNTKDKLKEQFLEKWHEHVGSIDYAILLEVRERGKLAGAACDPGHHQKDIYMIIP